MVTAIGMACGTGLLVLALFVTLLYFLIALAFPVLLRLVPGRPSPAESSARDQND